MNHELLKNAEQYHKKRQRHSVWRKALGILGCLVVFCTTYALILPALTMEKESFCGFTQHIHEESCYGIPAAPRQGICTAESLGVHVHTDSCCSGGVLTCGKADFLAHLHGESCYAADGTLWCPLPEVTTHSHGEDCYSPADPGHSHGDACYTAQRGELLCSLPEEPGHSHGESCYTSQQGELLCTETEGENHAHSEDCYERTSVLTCTVPEEPGHSHGDDCFALESVLACGQEEREGTEAVLTCTRHEQPLHHHSDSCYNGGALTCGKLQLESHVHGESCFVTLPAETTQPQLICSMTEHDHQLLCFSDPTADVESAAQWEATLPETLSGTAAEDLLAVARSQIGYKESVKNYTVLADGTTMQGYSRYGHWYGSRYGDWCAMFTAFCLHYADIPRSTMPYDANCGVWVDLLKAKDQFRSAEDYTPVPGDIIFFDYNNSRQADHVGIVLSVDSENNKLTTIEGNHSHRVDTFRYALSESDILGYGLLAGAGGETAETTVSAVIYTDLTCTVPATDDTIITVSGLLPPGAQVLAYAVTPDSPTVNGQLLVCAYDITVLDTEGQVLTHSEDGTPFTVTIRPAGWTGEDGGNCTVYYLPDGGQPQAMDTHKGEEAVSFTTDHFSVYALAVDGIEDAIYLSGTTGSDSGDGLTPDSAVQTVERAMALARSGGTVYITGTVTVSGDAEWDCGSSTVTFRRHSDFTGPLVTVANGGSLTLGRGVTLHGGSAESPLIAVRDGGELVLRHGATLTGNTNTAGNGGAVYCEGTMTMLGGTIRDCEARYGGGIYLDGGAVLTMLGGTADGNSAENGGGLYVAPGSQAFLSGGSITNNTATGHGGGIWLGGHTVLNRAVICGNSAEETGGGIAAGSAAHVLLYDHLSGNGGAVFGNTAAGADSDLSGESSSLTLAETALGGGSYGWQQNGSHYTTSLSSEAQSDARAEAHVLITGNRAAVGGGIDCDGLLEVGGEEKESTFIHLQKIWADDNAAAHPAYIEVQILQDGAPYGDPVRIHRTYDDSGSEVWPTLYAGGLPLGCSYTVEAPAIPGYTATVEQNGQDFLITSQPAAFRVVVQWLGDAEEARPASTAVQLYRNEEPYGEAVTLSAENGWSFSWAELPSQNDDGSACVYTARQITVPEGYYTSSDGQITGNTQTITNRPIPRLSVSAETQWSGEDQHPDAVQLQLLYNGSPYGEAVTLSAESDWLWQWNDLCAVDSAGQAVAYTVEALPVPGYQPRVETAQRTTQDGEILHFLVINEPKDSLSVQILKCSTGTDENGDPVLLAGAELALYRLGGDTQIPGTTISGTLLEQWTSESINGLSGGIHTVELTDGTYYLVETRAPAGHMRLADPLVFCIEDRVVTQMPAGSSAGAGILTVRVYNTLAYAMPQTGGIGTTPYTLGGLLLMFSAAILLLHNRKKQRKGDPASS